MSNYYLQHNTFFFQSLLLLNYLVKNGSERCVTGAREHLYDLRALENYTFTDENGKDQGLNGIYHIYTKYYTKKKNTA